MNVIFAPRVNDICFKENRILTVIIPIYDFPFLTDRRFIKGSFIWTNSRVGKSFCHIKILTGRFRNRQMNELYLSQIQFAYFRLPTFSRRGLSLSTFLTNFLKISYLFMDSSCFMALPKNPFCLLSLERNVERSCFPIAFKKLQ